MPAGPAAPAPVEVFRARRERLLELAGGAVVLLASNPELFRSRDTEVPYRQNTDFYYLTGVEEPEAFAVLTPHDAAHRFTLFMRPRDPDRERWNGPRIGVEAAMETYGADAVYPIGDVDERAAELIAPADRLLYALGADPALDTRVLEILSRARRARARSGAGPTTLVDLDSLLAEMRKIKDPHEIERMRCAAAIGAAGHRAAMARARPGIGEWELEAILEGTFRSHGAAGPAFASIVGSGENATFLHYTQNDSVVPEDALVLIDAGAEWGMYCSDITRTFPASGRFTAPQRELYELVLQAENAAIEAVRPGVGITAVHDAAVGMLVAGMVRLGILQDVSAEEAIESGSYRRFYMHQTSHWLGLDVHDVGLYRRNGTPITLEPGMVLTIEPGIYISRDSETVPAAYRGIGIRIEDDVLVTDYGREILTRGVPVDPDEVERLVGAG
ncbi:MAG: aminopeptidase P N-terminal domain-containing protein [Gemmatimonadetes bacterium]|nr:aminopeptidase P N-terminal domain-containing protein [Gemmatimonadota bacterium]